MLLPMTSRSRAAANSPLKPCWKPIVFSCPGLACGCGSVELLDGVERHLAAVVELELRTGRGVDHALDRCMHEGVERHRLAAGGRGDGEGVVAGWRRGAGVGLAV